MVKRGYSLVRYADNFVMLEKSKDETLRAYDSAKFFLHNNLSLRFNFETVSVRNIEEGFIFLGILFRNGRKTISENRFLNIQNRIKQIFKVREQFEFPDKFLDYQLSAFIMRKPELKEKINELRDSLIKVEFFIEKSAEEKKRYAELLVARSRIKKIPEKTISPATHQVDKVPLSIEKAVEKKKKYYNSFSRSSYFF